VSPARYLIDTSVLTRLLLADGDDYGWDRAVGAGLIALCSPVELEYLRTAKSKEHGREIEAIFLDLFGWASADERMFRRAREVQRELLWRGEHRGSSPVDLLIAATAELNDLTLLHLDNDFECIARITGQPMERFGSPRRQSE
jgi:predicted nucleic acid-binding protein